MQSLFDDLNSIKFLSPELQLLASGNSTNFTNKQLLEVLLDQNSKIQKFLHSQELLSNTLSLYQRHETTDSEHIPEQFEYLQAMEVPEDQPDGHEDINSFIQYHQNHFANLQKEAQKNMSALRQMNSRSSRKKLKTSKMPKKPRKIYRNGLNKYENDKDLTKWFVHSLYDFMMTRKNLLTKILTQFKMQDFELAKILKQIKNEVSGIKDLKKLFWGQKQEKSSVVRAISMFYLRKGCLESVSRQGGKQSMGELKWRRKIIRELRRRN